METELVPFARAGLTAAWAKKAEEEFGETAERKARALLDFRRMVEAQKEIRCRTDDLFLLRFIRLKKYDLDGALRILRKYVALQSRYEGVYTGIRPSQVSHIVEMKTLGIAPFRLPTGSHVAWLRMGDFNWDVGNVAELIAADLIFGEIVLQYEATQLFGCCLVFDMAGMTLLHYLKFVQLSVFKFALDALQDCFPMKITAIHIINEPLWFHTVYRLMKPMMKTKMKQRMILHGDKMESLHESVPPQFLPTEFGGTLETAHEDVAALFIAYERCMDSHNANGTTQGTR